jgi:hypothetical protein
VASLEAALAVIATAAGAVKVAPLTGDVILTVGGTPPDDAELTLTLSKLEVFRRALLWAVTPSPIKTEPLILIVTPLPT